MSKPSQVEFGFTAKQIITENRVTQGEIDSIKNWLNNNELPELSEEQITLFLLSCNNDENSTKATIKAFYRIKKQSPEIFDNRKIERENLQQQLKTG